MRVLQTRCIGPCFIRAVPYLIYNSARSITSTPSIYHKLILWMCRMAFTNPLFREHGQSQTTTQLSPHKPGQRSECR